MKPELEAILAYHQTSKHNFKALAPGPHRLDMLNQPDPFLNYQGTRVLTLERWTEKELDAELFPAYEQAFAPERLKPSELNYKTISRLFFDSFAISAWRRAGGSKWALRVNPSSGNLHPTEVYFISGPVKELLEKPGVCHYAPLPHALELRTEFPENTWRSLSSDFPEGTFFVGLSTIYWRVSWKYGLRAFRYGNHDLGHAIGAITFAAAGLGWKTDLLADISSEEVSTILGISRRKGPEKEEPACLLAIYPAGEDCHIKKLPSSIISSFNSLSWNGIPNILSPRHIEWEGIDKAIIATRKKETDLFKERGFDLKPDTGSSSAQASSISDVPENSASSRSFAHFSKSKKSSLSKDSKEDIENLEISPLSPLRQIIHKRRSALELDNSAYMDIEVFYEILKKCLPENNPVFNPLSLGSYTHMLFFVNRVKDLLPGLYIFLRKPEEKENFKAAIRPDFLWEKPKNCPEELEFYLLMEETLHNFIAQLSCSQRKAADACFTVCMLSEFEKPLNEFGPRIYPYLIWECGILGQLLYLEAEAYGLRGCGIGCFFDDPLHDVIGLKGFEYQDLYHFSVGSTLEERGFVTLPAYEK